MKNKITFIAVALIVVAGIAFVISNNNKSQVKTGGKETAIAAKDTKTAKIVIDENAAAAVVNGQEIKRSKIMTALSKLSLNNTGKKKAFYVLVNQAISEQLINKEIENSKIEENPIFKKRLKATEEQLSKTFYLENYLKSEITEKAINTEYKKLKKENSGKEEVHARQILLKTKEEAEQVIKDLNRGADFKILAKKRSADPSSKNGGDVGYFAKGEIIPAFSDAAFKLKPGTYTKKPVKSPFGWHVIYLEGKRSRKVPELKAVENRIRAKLGQKAIEKLITTLRAKADIKQFDINGQPVKETKKN